MIAENLLEIDVANGLVPRAIFHDPEIYAAELKNIFGRCWLFLAHESQIPNPGDYVTVRMGEIPVIVTRDTNGKINALINSCRHRGNAVVRYDAGNARTFTCNYHGWCYDLQGKRTVPGGLVGLPGMDPYYHDRLDLAQWGLVAVAQVQSYRGLAFATFDPQAPPLEEYLNDFRWALDLIFDRGDLTVIPGVLRWRVPCNWKFASDNAIGDNSHTEITHRAAYVAFNKVLGAPMPAPSTQQPGFTILTEYGHGMNCQTGRATREGTITDTKAFKRLSSAAEWWRSDEATVTRVGPANAAVRRYNGNLFPNLFIIDRILFVRNPLGPGMTEIRAIALYDRNAPQDVQLLERRAAMSGSGPAGIVEQDDAENWSQSTDGTAISALEEYDLNYTMALGAGTFVNDDGPPRIDTMINEHGPLWFYRAWADSLRAPNWPDLRKHHARPFGTI